METGRRLCRTEHGNVVGQRRVQRLGSTLGRWATLDLHRDDLPDGMDAGVRAPRHRQRIPAGVDGVERVAHDPFDRGLPRLARPAAVPGAVVLEREAKDHARSLAHEKAANCGRSRQRRPCHGELPVVDFPH